MAKKAVKVVKEKKVKPELLVEITINGEVWKGEGNDLHEILKTYEVPASVKTEAVVKLTKGKQSREELLSVNNARRAFGGSNVSLELLASNLLKLLG